MFCFFQAFGRQNPTKAFRDVKMIQTSPQERKMVFGKVFQKDAPLAGHRKTIFHR